MQTETQTNKKLTKFIQIHATQWIHETVQVKGRKPDVHRHQDGRQDRDIQKGRQRHGDHVFACVSYYPLFFLYMAEITASSLGGKFVCLAKTKQQPTMTCFSAQQCALYDWRTKRSKNEASWVPVLRDFSRSTTSTRCLVLIYCRAKTVRRTDSTQLSVTLSQEGNPLGHWEQGFPC